MKTRGSTHERSQKNTPEPSPDLSSRSPDPYEGHLRIEVEVKDGRVSEARSVGTLYRGLETILVGRDPRDVQHFTQRTLRRVHLYPRAGLPPAPSKTRSRWKSPRTPPTSGTSCSGCSICTTISCISTTWHALDFVDVTSALQADPVKQAKICSSVSPRPASADGFKAVQAKLKAFVESGQLGPFTNAYFLGGHPAYYLDPEANLIGHGAITLKPCGCR